MELGAGRRPIVIEQQSSSAVSGRCAIATMAASSVVWRCSIEAVFPALCVACVRAASLCRGGERDGRLQIGSDEERCGCD